MKRWHQDQAHCRRQRCLRRRYQPECHEELGRYRKKHALDCGKVHCQVCHGGKYPERELHEHEILADLNFREQLCELSEE